MTSIHDHAAGMIAIVMPTYNEATNVGPVVSAVLAHVPAATVIVVDDDSPDGTGAALDALAAVDGRIVPIHRRARRGYGRSCVEGLQRALSLGATRVVQMDADFSHDPAAIPELLRASADYDLVIGSRYVDGVRVLNWPLRRLLLSGLANRYVRAITGLRLRDVTSGFRCWRREAVERLALDRVRSDGYAFLVELTYLTSRAGLRIGEVPITFTERVDGVSKMSRRVILESALMPWRLVLGRTPRRKGAPP